MNPTNHSMVTYFILKGLSDVAELQVLIFFLVLFMYLICLSGNLTIILLICLDRHLHTPMYFFLANLSVIDISYSTVTLHKIFTSFILKDNTISHFSCVTQYYFFATLTACELYILTSMSYDRYVAINNPLCYHMVMNGRVCSLLATFSWFFAFIQMIPHVIILSGLTCFISREINHFSCDIGPLAQLTCSDTRLLELGFLINTTFLATCPPLLTFISYVFIIITVMRIKSSTGRRKAFSTCSSHLTVVILLYVTLICQYVKPNLKDSLQYNKYLSLFNTAAVPMLNPIIYSLKNKDVKLALKRRRCIVIV